MWLFSRSQMNVWARNSFVSFQEDYVNRHLLPLTGACRRVANGVTAPGIHDKWWPKSEITIMTFY